jgi:hypothetical protein
MKKISSIIMGIAMAAFLSYIIYRAFQLRNNFRFTTGHIYDIRASGNKYNAGDFAIFYEYFVDGVKYQGDNGYFYCDSGSLKKIKLLFMGKSFPLVYAENIHGAGFLIITQKGADKYNYTIPDSLRMYDSVLSCK